MQPKQQEWVEQWSRFKDDSTFLFTEWIYPNRLEDFRDRRVLDAGCGHGHHMLMVAPYAREVIGVDLNTAPIAQAETRTSTHLRTVESDIATVHFPEPFDIVYCVGVIHHTDDPDQTVRNLIRHLKTGGALILWVYSREGNFLAAKLVEPFRKLFLKNINTVIIQ